MPAGAPARLGPVSWIEWQLTQLVRNAVTSANVGTGAAQSTSGSVAGASLAQPTIRHSVMATRTPSSYAEPRASGNRAPALG